MNMAENQLNRMSSISKLKFKNTLQNFHEVLIKIKFSEFFGTFFTKLFLVLPTKVTPIF